jgi:zinc transport system substrate-binding protein
VIRAGVLVVALAALLPGCGRGSADDRLRIEAGLYPLAFVAQQVGGQHVDVDNLTRAGTEPHDVELTPKQVSRIEQAQLVVAIKGLQTAIDDAATRERTIDVGDGSADPHVWLDPVALADIGDRVADRLATLDRDNASDFRLGAAALRSRLTDLDAEYRRGLRSCARHDIVTSHEAFGHLARRYGLTQLGISGVTPESEPSPNQIARISRLVRERGVTTVFAEALVSPKAAETVAREADVRTAVLDPVEGVGDGEDYFTVMRRNLSALRTGLGCR